MADLPPGVIPISADKFDRLYPAYEREARPGQKFQEWLRVQRRESTRKRMRVVHTSSTEPT
jgi:hypothetical protein